MTEKYKVEFAEGCFDELAEEMTQEELDALIAEIHRLAESGELVENCQQLTPEEEAEVMFMLNEQGRNTRQ